MATKYEQDTIFHELIYNGYINSFGWSDDQGTNFEVTIESCDHIYRAELIFEFATEFEIQLYFGNKGDNIPIKHFKYFFNNSQYNIDIEFGSDVTGYIRFNCYNIHCQLNGNEYHI